MVRSVSADQKSQVKMKKNYQREIQHHEGLLPKFEYSAFVKSGLLATGLGLGARCLTVNEDLLVSSP